MNTLSSSDDLPIVFLCSDVRPQIFGNGPWRVLGKLYGFIDLHLDLLVDLGKLFLGGQVVGEEPGLYLQNRISVVSDAIL